MECFRIPFKTPAKLSPIIINTLKTKKGAPIAQDTPIALYAVLKNLYSPILIYL